uniref:DUF6653 family protein n=1 Tax=Lentzea alba TaxID=2714351 RepID=UPI0039BF8711
MDDEAWRRHANPWSVSTRFAAIPATLPAIWSRTSIGWWCLVPIGLVVVWPVVKPRSGRWTRRAAGPSAVSTANGRGRPCSGRHSSWALSCGGQTGSGGSGSA